MDNPNFYHGFPFAVKREVEELETRPRIRCEGCGGTDFDSGDDGFFYCRDCGGQSQDMLETDCAEDDMFAETGALYNTRYVRHSQSQSRPLSVSQSQSQSQVRSKAAKEEMLRSLARNLGGLGNVKKEEERPHGFDDEFSQPMDFGNVPFPDEKTLADGIRLRYVQGMQLMIQMQCKELVERFGVSPLICGIVGEVWLRYLVLRKVFDESWADKAILEAEAAARERHGSRDHTSRGNDDSDSHAFSRRKPVFVWVSSLRSMIPIHSSLAFTFLACHIAREQILPTDLVNWATEGKLPYISAFSDIEKSLGNPGAGFPLSSRSLFRPVYTPGTWQMEATAGSIAHCVGLHLPPVNFYAIAQRYLRQLSLPLEKILQHACHIYEWSMPADLWLSANPFRLPTRVCVMSILMISIRILYGIHGYGVWETSFSPLKNPSSSTQKRGDLENKCNTTHSHEENIDPESEKGLTLVQDPQFDTVDLLCKLEAKYNGMMNTPDHSRDLRSYLKYCKDIVFAGMTTSYEEERLMEALWDIYEKQESEVAGCSLQGNAPETEERGGLCDGSRKRSREEDGGAADGAIRHGDEGRWNPEDEGAGAPNGDPPAAGKEAAVARMRQSMKENGFEYLPPRSRRRTDGYLHYRRKKIEGRLLFVAHADYFILLRACARLARVDARIMHLGVLKLERRLRWLERRVGRSLAALRRRREGASAAESAPPPL